MGYRCYAGEIPGHGTHIGSLSGGNQQKVIIGRWLLTQPELLGITDRIQVMNNGQIVGIVNTKETSQNEILRLASL